MVKIAITGLVCAVVGLTTLSYSDSYDPPTEEDIAYMMQTLEDAAEGCRVFLNPAVPGNHMTEGVIEEGSFLNGRASWPATHYCIDVDVFNVGSCIGHADDNQERVTLSVLPYQDGEYHLRDNDNELLIHSQSHADDFTILLTPSPLSHSFVQARGYEADIWLNVVAFHNAFGHIYTVIYDPATETFRTFRETAPYTLTPAPKMAKVLREPVRKFFARLRSIIETGIVPAVEPLPPCPELELDE